MRILIVEDEQKIANSLRKGFEQESYAVDVTYDGREGYEMAISEEYDVIILDRLMPKMSGIELCKKLREEKNHTPIIMLTARGEVDDRVDGLNAGADDYLPKPFAFTELLARVRAVSRRPKTAVSAVLQVADLTLDSVTFEAVRGKTRISLSSKEYALLEYLMRHKGKVVKKEQIMTHVWNYDADVMPNSVEVYITHLRNKIDKPFAGRELISTVRGFGYKIG
jgi:DNA-binding response OmpR family regulator